MLDMVEVVTPQGRILALPLRDPSDGYLVQKIDGLGPVKATIASSSATNRDGEQYHASRREKRNIVMTIGLEADYTTETVQALRSRLYGYLMPKANVTLRFYFDGLRGVDILCKVESFDAELFTSEPAVVISLLCFDPDFIAPTSVAVDGVTTAGTTELEIDYPGNVSTGISFLLRANRDFTEMTIYNSSDSGDFEVFQFNETVNIGDELLITTSPGNKSAMLTRFGEQRSALFGVSPDSAWIRLHPGMNRIRVAISGDPTPYTIEYQARYGGL